MQLIGSFIGGEKKWGVTMEILNWEENEMKGKLKLEMEKVNAWLNKIHSN